MDWGGLFIASYLTTINKELGDNALQDRILDQVFDTYWPLFDKKFKSVIANAPVGGDIEPARTKDDILTEILYTTRTLEKRIRQIEGGSDSFRVDRKFSEMEIIERIALLIDKGLSPKEVAMEFEGIAPFEFVMGMATQMLDKSKFRKSKLEKMQMPSYSTIV